MNSNHTWEVEKSLQEAQRALKAILAAKTREAQQHERSLLLAALERAAAYIRAA